MPAHSRFRHLLRDLAIIGGVALAVGFLVFFGIRVRFIMEGWSRVLGLERDVLVSQSHVPSVLHSELPLELAGRIEQIPGVTDIDPGGFGLARIGPLSFFALFGYEPGSRSSARYRIVAGEPPTAPGQIAVGRRGAVALQIEVGDALELFGETLQVVGLYEAPEPPEELGGLLPLAQLQRLRGTEQTTSFFQVGLEPGLDKARILTEIESLRPGISAVEAAGWRPNPGIEGFVNRMQWGYSAAVMVIAGLVVLLAGSGEFFRNQLEIAAAKADRRWRRCLRLALGRTTALPLAGGALGVTLAVVSTEVLRRTSPSGAFMEGLPIYAPQVFLRAAFVVVGAALVGTSFSVWTLFRRTPEEIRAAASGARDAPTNLQGLWRRGRPSVLGLVASAVAVAGFWVVAGFESGVPRQLNDMAGSGPSGAVTVYQRDAPGLTVSSLPKGLADRLLQLPSVQSVTPVLLGHVESTAYPFLPVVGLPQLGGSTSGHYRLAAGRWPRNGQELLLGRRAARDHRLEPGDPIQLDHEQFQISGVFESGLAWEEHAAVLALPEAQHLMDKEQSVSLILVQPHKGRGADVVLAVEEGFPRARARLSREFFQGTEDMAKVRGTTGPLSTLGLMIITLLLTNVLLLSAHRRRPLLASVADRPVLRRRLLVRSLMEGCVACLAAGVLGAGIGFASLGLVSALPWVGPILSAAHGGDAEVWTKTARGVVVAGVVAVGVSSWRLWAGRSGRSALPAVK